MGTQNTSTYVHTLYGHSLYRPSGLLARFLLGFLAAGMLQAHAQVVKKGPPAGTALAQALPPAAKPAKADDKVDISDLENKYWAPKDTDFSVVQNRTYTKERRWFGTLHFGRPVNDQWSVGNIYGISGNYFWNERAGVQLTWLQANLSNNESTDHVANNYGSGVFPDHNRITGYKGVGFTVVPFYAKMSFWGKRIIYFDMAITPTLGVTEYTQLTSAGNRTNSALTYGFDITQYFFFTNYFAIRADLKSQWHKEDILRFYTSGGLKTGEKVKDQIAQDTMFLLGLTFFY